MSSAIALRFLCRHSLARPVYPCHSFGLPPRLDYNRQFTTTAAVLAPKIVKRKKLTKKVAAAKAKRKALKARKSVYAHEQMTLADAIAVLRVRISVLVSLAPTAIPDYLSFPLGKGSHFSQRNIRTGYKD
jgi:hypothetical protein